MKLSIIIVAIICSLISATSAKLGGSVVGDGGRSLKAATKSDKKKADIKSGKSRTLKAGDKGGVKSEKSGNKLDKGRTLKAGGKGGVKSEKSGNKLDKGI